MQAVRARYSIYHCSRCGSVIVACPPAAFLKAKSSVVRTTPHPLHNRSLRCPDDMAIIEHMLYQGG
jgi:hypothetical protein